jgi:hypothetical protein
MFEISFQQLALIKSEVGRADISFSHLQYDLIDHVCCDVENAMSQGLSFEKAYEMVKQRIGIRGLQRIQEETLLLINKKYRIMKTTMKIFGVISTILLAFGTLFKIEHWFGAGILLTLGFFLLCFVFLPSTVYVNYCEVSNKTKRWTHILGFLSAFIISAGFLFKIQHWPGAGFLITIGITMAMVLFLPALCYQRIKSSTTKILAIINILTFLGIFIYLAGFLSKIQHWPGASMMLLTGSLLTVVIAFPLHTYVSYKNSESVSSRFIFTTVALMWFILPTMLLSLNVSQKATSVFFELQQDIDNNIQHVTSKNQLLYNKLLVSTYPDSASNKEMIMNLRKQSDDLVGNIQAIKIQIVSANEGQRNNNWHEGEKINTEYIYSTEMGSEAKQILFGMNEDGEAAKIKTKLKTFQNQLLISTEHDSLTKVLLTNLFSSSMPYVAKDDPENKENDMIRSYTLISTLNKLSSIQENIRIAENIVLMAMIQAKAGNKLIALVK